MRAPWTAVLPLATVALVAAGCGGGSSGSSSSQSTGSASTAASQTGNGYGGPSTSTGTSTTAAAARAAVVKTRGLALGTVLVGPTGRTLYLFEKDRGPTSACSGECAQDWPPLTTSGAPKATGAKAAMLTTIKRADGSKQVAYGGHPLYYYAGDQQPGQDNGQGLNAFGASWFVVTPAGKKIA